MIFAHTVNQGRLSQEQSVSNGMNILMIGTDRKLFEPASEVKKRFITYASLFNSLRVIVFTRLGYEIDTNSPQLSLYPTNSLHRLLYIWNAYRMGRRLQGVDVVSAQDPFECGIAGWLIARRLGAKLQLQIHTDFLSPYFIQGSFINRVRVYIARFLLSRASCIRVVSEYIKISLIKKLSIKELCITTLPIFVDNIRKSEIDKNQNIREQYASASHIILMASRFTYEKNILMGVRAMQEVIKKHPKALLLLVGDGPEKSKIQKYIHKHNLQQNVIIKPWTENIYQYYKSADIFMMTSFYEGYGRTAIEAAYQNVPVIMTDVGIAIGSVVPIGHHKQLATSLIELIEHPDIRKRIVSEQKAFLSSLPSRDEYNELFKNQFNTCV